MEGNPRFSDTGPESSVNKTYRFLDLPQPLPFEIWIDNVIAEASRELDAELSIELLIEYITTEYRGLVLDERQKSLASQKLDSYYGRDLYSYDVDF